MLQRGNKFYTVTILQHLQFLASIAGAYHIGIRRAAAKVATRQKQS
jgi:hypothetical protein